MSAQYTIGGGKGVWGGKAVLKRDKPYQPWRVVRYFHGATEYEKLRKAKLWIQQQEQHHDS